MFLMRKEKKREGGGENTVGKTCVSPSTAGRARDTGLIILEGRQNQGANERAYQEVFRPIIFSSAELGCSGLLIVWMGK